MKETITFRLNGEEKSITVEPADTLLYVLRNELQLTGTKYGCGVGQCGACTVLINNEPQRSCMMEISEVAGKEVVTIEGLAKNGNLHPIQKAFIEHDALQCGFCTPGMIIHATGLLTKNPMPTEQEIIDEMEDNLCRCGAHKRIIEAIQTAANEMEGGM